MEAKGKQENVTKNGNNFEEKAVDRKESGIPIYSPTMITMRAPSDMMDREAIVAFNQNPESSTTNNGQPRNDMDWLGTIRKRTHNEPERGKLAITETQPYGEIDTNGIELNGHTMLTKRFEERQVNAMHEVVNKSITDGCNRNKVEEYRRPGGRLRQY